MKALVWFVFVVVVSLRLVVDGADCFLALSWRFAAIWVW